MSYDKRLATKSFNYPPSSINAAAGGFTKADKKVIGRWVAVVGNYVILTADNGRVDGCIISVDERSVGVELGPICKGKHSDNAVIADGSMVIGATREVTSGGGQERGFIKAVTVTTVAQVRDSRGPVISSGTNTANTEGTANTEVLMW